MLKKILSAGLAVCMVVGLTACNSGDKKPQGTQGVTEVREDGSNPGAISQNIIEPRYFFSTGSYIFSGKEPVFETIEYYTNIKFKPEAIPLASYNEKISTTLSSGNLPDLICMRDSNMAKKYALKGAFVDLSEYIDKGEMPNFVNMIKKYPPAESLHKNSDGKIYGTARIYDATVMDQSWIVRQDLLKKHNIPQPKNFDEMYDVMVKLKELYPDSYPLTNRWNAGHAISAQAYFRNASAGMFINLDTKEYDFGPTQPGYKDALEYMKKCYENGLLHPEFATLSDEQFFEQFANNKAFMTYDYVVFVDDNILKTSANILDEGFDLSSFVQPEYNGKRYGLPVLKGYYGMTKVIAQNSPYKDELVRYLDWQYSEEGIDAMSFGIKGKMWNEDETGKITFEDGYDPTKIGPSESGLRNVDFLGVVSDKAQRAITINPNTQAGKSYLMLEEQKAFEEEPTISASWYNEDNRKEYSDLMTPINTYIEEASLKVITGKMPISDWDTVVIPQAEKMGYKRALELIRQAHKETLQK